MSIAYRAPYTFYGVPQPRSKAQVSILPVPYEGTVSYQRGTSLGPHAIITASRQIELYDIELRKDVSRVRVQTLPELEPSTHSPAKVVQEVQEATVASIRRSGFQVMIGGEHSLTLGAVRAYAKKYPDLSILQLDAHTDLRETYEDSKYNHACVMRRCHEVVSRVVQCGIRNQSLEETKLIERNKWGADVFYDHEWTPEDILARLSSHVYLTLDVDVFDPSIMPATGTPEPGGMLWDDFCSLLRAVMKSVTVVGADVVELAPLPGNAAPDFLAAKAVHKIIAYHQFRSSL